MTARVPYAQSFDHLVYVRVFEGCNLHCEHCFIPKNPKRMDHDAVAGVADHLRQVAKPGQNILVQWHGGEPTMFGADWMAEAIDRLERAGPEFTFSHGIQTNLMTYSPAWGRLFRERFADGLGVSWDPGIRLLARGKPETNVAYEERFWSNLSQLVADGLDPYVVMTATKPFFETFRNPLSLFEMLTSRGIRKAHIERLTETGYARENWERVGVDNAAYSAGMARILRAYSVWRSGRDPSDPKLVISPFDGLIASAQTLAAGEVKGGYGCWSGSCDTRFHTVDASGYKRGCTALTSESDNKAARTKLDLSQGFEKVRGTRRLVNCKECSFRTICSSGCLAVSMDDGSGECSGGRGVFEAAMTVVQHGGGFQ
jgi:radical SAM protein with 4Fe4S-binding SPASM domain